ncbi:hypothetical protein FNA67_01930 [Youhaiella tibetensis]|uniref:Uncharacterized protein n=1 Tax=Paradevosia tibetensis TaxID=1447062 RepID=A0A5B9DJZ1_9HYPH|nr:hypothetical protein [Youhaiella tibetensis]QEE19009.1 hypothetical protein FNA67_01930 [Youhaiella tibetensis]
MLLRYTQANSEKAAHMADDPHPGHLHHNHGHEPAQRLPRPQQRAFSLAQQGLAVRLGIVAVLIAGIWLAVIALVQP